MKSQMNRMISAAILALGLVAVLDPATASAAVSRSEAAELQFHSAFKLINNNKVSAAFFDHVATVSVARSGAANAWIVTFVQEADAGATASTLTFVANGDGKTLSYNEVAGTPAAAPLSYHGASPLELLEKAFEVIADSSGDARITPYQEGLSFATVAPRAEGGAVTTFQAEGHEGALKIVVDQDGNTVSISE